MNTTQIKQNLNDLTAFIEQAQIKLAQGEVIDLSHLDKDVATLCEAAIQLPPTQAKDVQPAMGEMISKLEELSVGLKDFQSHLKERAEKMKQEGKK
jgi:hypothetical protein